MYIQIFQKKFAPDSQNVVVQKKINKNLMTKLEKVLD